MTSDRHKYAGQSAEWLANERFWRWTAIGLGIIAFWKGIREPNSWSYTQAQFDYSVGFMRRGLFGALLGRTLHLGLYAHFAVVSTVLLMVLLCVLGLFAYRAGLAEQKIPGELVAVYASSYSVTYLAHLNGYLDIPLALLCIVPLLMRSTGWRLAASLLCAPVGIFIHEQFFFAFLPALIVAVLLGAVTGSTKNERRVAWAGGLILAALGTALTWHLGSHGAISVAQTNQLRQSITARMDRPLNQEVIKVLARTARENEAVMKSVWVRPTFWAGQVESLLLFGPTIAVLSFATLLLLRRWMPGRYRWIYAGVLVATFAPVSLHLVGWDKNRWNQLLCLNAFLMLLTVSNLMAKGPMRLPVRLQRACLLVMLMNMATGGGLLDGRQVRNFPFMRNPNAVAAAATAPSQ